MRVAAPSKTVAQHKRFGNERERDSVAFRGYGARKLVFHLGFAGIGLPYEHQDGQQHIQRLKAADDNRNLPLVDKFPVGLFADDGRDVSRSDDAVDEGLGVLSVREHDVAHGRRRDDVRADNREVSDVLRPGRFKHQCRGRCGGFKSDRKKDHLTVGIFLRKLECVRRRIDHAHIGPLRLGLK